MQTTSNTKSMTFQMIHFKSSITRTRDSSGYNIINGHKILKTLGVGSEYKVRLGISLESSAKVCIYSQSISGSKIGFNKHADRLSYFRLLDKLNTHAIPGIRQVLEIWYDWRSCIQLHRMLLKAGVTFCEDTLEKSSQSNDSDNNICRKLFIITEYCDGGGLFPIIGKLHYSEYISLSHRLAITLNQLHNINIVHKDIKVDNILLSKTHLRNTISKANDKFDPHMNPCIIDFGISIDLDATKTRALTIDTMLSMLSDVLTKDFGSVTVSNWFGAEGLIHGILSSDERIVKITEIIVHYLRLLFIKEDIRIIADPLILQNAKFITNKQGTIAYSPPEIKWEGLLNSITDQPHAPETYTVPRTKFGATEILTDATGSSRYSNDSVFSNNAEGYKDLSINHSLPSLRDDTVNKQFKTLSAQGTLVAATIFHARASNYNAHVACRQRFKEFSPLFRTMSASSSAYAILPTCVDVWCFGVTILYILMGAARTKPLSRRGMDALNISQHLTPFTIDLLCGCLALDPVERYTAEDIARHPLYIGYRVSYEESDLKTYIVSIEQYRTHFNLELSSKKNIRKEAIPAVDACSDQISGNSLENYYQYVMRKRRRILIIGNKKHIRRASLSSLSVVSHEHIFKETYTDDTLLAITRPRWTGVFADPWISPVLLQLDLAAISLQIRNSAVRYLHSQDFPDTNTYLIPKFFDVAKIFSECNTIGQGLMSMKLKSLSYLATRLLGTVVCYNNLTDFKKYIMPEHVRGYTHSGELDVYSSPNSADWHKYRKRWGTKAFHQEMLYENTLMFQQNYLSSLTISSPESSTCSFKLGPDNIHKSVCRLTTSMDVLNVKNPNEIVERSAQMNFTDDQIFDIHNNSSTICHFESMTEEEPTSIQCSMIAEHTITAATEHAQNVSADLTSQSTEAFNASSEVFPVDFTMPSNSRAVTTAMASVKDLQQPSCDLLTQKSKFIELTLISHDVAEQRDTKPSSSRKPWTSHPKSSNLIPTAKLAMIKDSRCEIEHTDTLLKTPPTRALMLHNSYATKIPMPDYPEVMTKLGPVHTERSKELQERSTTANPLTSHRGSSVCSNSTPLHIQIADNTLRVPQTEDVAQIFAVTPTHVFLKTEKLTNNASHHQKDAIFKSHNLISETKLVTLPNTQSYSTNDINNHRIPLLTVLLDVQKHNEYDNDDTDSSADLNINIADVKGPGHKCYPIKFSTTQHPNHPGYTSLSLSSSSNEHRINELARFALNQKPSFAQQTMSQISSVDSSIKPLQQEQPIHACTLISASATTEFIGLDLKAASIDNHPAKKAVQYQLRNAFHSTLPGDFQDYWKDLITVTPITVKQRHISTNTKPSFCKRKRLKLTKRTQKFNILFQTSRADGVATHPWCLASNSIQMQSLAASIRLAARPKNRSSVTISSGPKSTSSWANTKMERTSISLVGSDIVTNDCITTLDTPTSLCAEEDICNEIFYERKEQKMNNLIRSVSKPSIPLSDQSASVFCSSNRSIALKGVMATTAKIDPLSSIVCESSFSEDKDSTTLSQISKGRSMLHSRVSPFLFPPQSKSQPALSNLPRAPIDSLLHTNLSSKDSTLQNPATLLQKPPHGLIKQFIRNMTQIELHMQSNHHHHNHKAPDTASDSDYDIQTSPADVFRLVEKVVPTKYRSADRPQRRSIRNTKKRQQKRSLTCFLLKELLSSNRTTLFREEKDKDTSCHSRFNITISVSTEVSESMLSQNDDEGNANKDVQNTSPEAESIQSLLFRFKTIDVLIRDLSTIASIDDQSVFKQESNQGADKTGLDSNNVSHSYLLNKSPSFHARVPMNRWNDKSSSSVTQLPLVETRQLGAIEKAFVARAMGSADKAKVTSVNRYDADNGKLQKAASYLRNLWAANISMQDASKIRTSACDYSETNNDDCSADHTYRLMSMSNRIQLSDSNGSSKAFKSYNGANYNASFDMHAEAQGEFSILQSTLWRSEVRPLSRRGCQDQSQVSPGSTELESSVLSNSSKEQQLNTTAEEGSLLLNDFPSAGQIQSLSDESIKAIKQRTMERQSDNLHINTAAMMARPEELAELEELTRDGITLSQSSNDSEDGHNIVSNTPIFYENSQKVMKRCKKSTPNVGDEFLVSSTVLPYFQRQSMGSVEQLQSAHDTQKDTDICFKRDTIDSSLINYVKRMPRFLNKFFSFSLTQSVISSATNVHRNLSGILFAHYYTHMRPYLAETLTTFNTHGFREMSQEFEVSISQGSANEVVFSSGTNEDVPSVIPGFYKTMSRNKVLRPVCASSKKTTVKQHDTLEVKIFDDLFNDVIAKEEIELLEVDGRGKKSNGSEFSLEDYVYESMTSIQNY